MTGRIVAPGYVVDGYFAESPTDKVVRHLDGGAFVELFVLDATALGGLIYRFHAGTNELAQPVVWQGETFQPFPVTASGFDFNGQSLPRPTLTASNVNGTLGALLYAYGDLVGATVTRKRTLVRYLDAVNFAGGNPDADPLSQFQDDVFFIEQKTAEDNVSITWELSSSADLQGTMLPRRQIIADVCTWAYRGPECGWTGETYFTAADVATAVEGEDQCGKRLASCRCRFGPGAEIPFGGFPACGKNRAA